MSHEKKRPVTIEDLLRMKRNEQPSAEFWEGFDRQLRAKQLAALVEKRPWWQRIHLRPSFAWRRYSLPLGAVAALAVTFVSLRHTPSTETSVPVQPTTLPAVAPVAAMVPSIPVPAPKVVVVHPAGVDLSAPSAARVAAEESASTPPTATLEDRAPVAVVAVADVAPVTPLLGIETKEPLALEKTPVVASFVPARVSSPVLAGGLLEVTQTDESRPVAAKSARVEEPLAQMTVSPPAARSRFNSMMMATVAAYLPKGPAEHVVQRHAQGLSDEQLLERPKGRLRAAGGDKGLWLDVRM